MFYFYRELESFDKTMMSVFKQHSLSLNEDLDVPFLKKWIIAFSKDGEKNIKKWNLSSNKITRADFVTEFNNQYFPYGETEFGGHGVISRIRVRNQIFLPLFSK